MLCIRDITFTFDKALYMYKDLERANSFLAIDRIEGDVLRKYQGKIKNVRAVEGTIRVTIDGEDVRVYDTDIVDAVTVTYQNPQRRLCKCL